MTQIDDSTPREPAGATAPDDAVARRDRSVAWPGSMYPLGATFDGEGTNFAVYSEVADVVDLCLIDTDGSERRVPLPETTAFVHHGYLPGVMPGQRYGFRVHGPWSPAQGLLCNPHKFLVDPYAKAVSGTVTWNEAVYASDAVEPDRMNTDDSLPFMPHSVVVHEEFDWEGDTQLGYPLHQTVVYEAHVRGMTMAHPDVPPGLRGTYAGMASEPIIEHLVNLGVTAVELMPVHQFVDDHFLVDRGLRNYWGYNTLAFLAPHGAYSAAGDSGGQVTEFKQMVKAFHRAGIEVILDVVYNHTAEGNHLGPMLSLKGFDNGAYYRLNPEQPRYYVDFTGTGNSLDMRHSQTLQLMMDSLRYWILEMHVDGFRFDLASTLARGLHDVDRLSSFFDLIHQDPVVNQVKLIAEPWDVGPGGYQVGNFPPLWSEWNAKFRDGVRDFWRGADETLADFASRLTGSSDLYAWSGRVPSASINFVTAHDGFTLADLVAYNEKHNEANGENNRDGESHNRSWNSGVEGPTNDPKVKRIRRTRTRSLLTTLLLSQGVPMLLAGDEMGRTQHGNNNAYCQDSTLSWIDWATADRDLIEFTTHLIAMRRRHPIFRRRRWFEGRHIHGDDAVDMGWYQPDGSEMTSDDWAVGYASALTVFMNGKSITRRGRRGERIVDDDFMMMFNAHGEALDFAIPPELGPRPWTVEIDTADGHPVGHHVSDDDRITVGPWGTIVLKNTDHS
ncbi:MAG: glycogen debranching protein GlgX [Acidimicrobiales bacterium]|nr:glycogen debranching protein GlgX [Acidimicrobiales bacterium]